MVVARRATPRPDPNPEVLDDTRVQMRPRRQPAAGSENGHLVEIGKSHRAILTVLAQHPGGCEKGKLTLLAGLSWTGTFRTYLSALRTAGYISGGNHEAMRITGAGLDALGHYEMIPSPGPELAEYWCRNTKFNETERQILRAFVSHPRGLTAEQICEVVGKEWTGTLRTYLSNLRTSGVIVGRNNEVMRASEDLL
jgi:hypothetical protein